MEDIKESGSTHIENEGILEYACSFHEQTVSTEKGRKFWERSGMKVSTASLRSRKVTCRWLGVILEENTPEELQKRVLTALENAGVFTSGLVKDKSYCLMSEMIR
ncbi:hypothetical protein L2E82_01043 [Cichorium intybus]|uniref:Uncharacterized protein n=1 Tax=Cichorium intybus TaxID=13427 RepID=A0ACB9GYY5_CICIN|nr:hypothetical protein L2E82_01043 [Cichorium intybus]